MLTVQRLFAGGLFQPSYRQDTSLVYMGTSSGSSQGHETTTCAGCIVWIFCGTGEQRPG